MEIQEKLNSYKVFAAKWSTNAQAAQHKLDKEIGRIRKKIKMLEVSTKDIESRWLERLLTGESTVRRPPRHMEKLERWGAALEMLRPLQRVSLALNNERYEFTALIGTCERTCGNLAESQERLSKFQALANSFPGDRTFAEQLRQETVNVEKRKVELDGQLARMASLLADAKKRGFVRS